MCHNHVILQGYNTIALINYMMSIIFKNFMIEKALANVAHKKQS